MKVPGLRPLRERSGLTQRDLAETAGVARRSIAGWESGESIRPNSASKVAEALGVSISALCEEWIDATINLAQPPRDERTKELLAMLRRYAEMAERHEKYDLSAAQLTQLSGYLARESVFGVAQAVDRGDHVLVADIIGPTRTVLDWLQILSTEKEEREAAAWNWLQDPQYAVAEPRSGSNKVHERYAAHYAAQLAPAGTRARPERGKDEG